MQELLDAIRAAVAPEASAESRAAGAGACRAIMTTLEARPGEPITSAITTPASPIAAIVSGLRGVPADQLLDLAIAKLRSMLPADANVPKIAPLKFITVPVPRRGSP